MLSQVPHLINPGDCLNVSSNSGMMHVRVFIQNKNHCNNQLSVGRTTCTYIVQAFPTIGQNPDFHPSHYIMHSSPSTLCPYLNVLTHLKIQPIVWDQWPVAPALETEGLPARFPSRFTVTFLPTCCTAHMRNGRCELESGRSNYLHQRLFLNGK